ncbi:AMP-binding protein [Candidatus Dependentiae bacterium]|nr:AMP-binding protein [Candidatus Dependentiae bacterium]
MTEQQRYNQLSQELLEGTPVHAGELLRRAARLWPDNSAVICQDQSITYGQLHDRACLMAEKLKIVGVLPNDHVLIYYENSIDFFIAYWGAWQAGAVVAPLNVFLQTSELLGILHDAHPRVIIVSDKLKLKLDELPQEELPLLLSTQDIAAISSFVGSIPHNPIPPRALDDLAALLYTSGTTGFPKGVMLSSRNIISNAIQGISRFKAGPEDRTYCALPLFHSFPQNVCVWSSCIIGSSSIIIPKVERRMLLEGFKHKPTVIIAVPALYGLFCLMKTVPFGPIRYFFAGGDALSDKIRAYFELIYRRKICNGYGLTESSPFIAVDLDDYTQPTSTVGRPFCGIKCSIRDDEGKELPEGSVGVLWITGDNIMLGYYKAPEATRAVLRDGWLNTGDLAYINPQGKIVISGRQRDLIINKGVKIYPQEVENVLLSNGQVTQAAVIGIAQNQEEIPVAFIGSRTTDKDALIAELKELCLRTLAPYKVPREFIIKRELPVTSTGKTDKKKLKAEYTKLF